MMLYSFLFDILTEFSGRVNVSPSEISKLLFYLDYFFRRGGFICLDGLMDRSSSYFFSIDSTVYVFFSEEPGLLNWNDDGLV